MAASTSTASMGAGGAAPQNRTFSSDGQVVVQGVGVAQEPDPATQVAPVAGVGEVVAEHGGLALHTSGEKARAGARHRGASCRRRSPPSQEEDLAALDDKEVGPGEGGEAPDEGDGAHEVDDRAPWAGEATGASLARRRSGRAVWVRGPDGGGPARRGPGVAPHATTAAGARCLPPQPKDWRFFVGGFGPD